MLVDGIVGTLIGLVAALGWFVCVGHLVASRVLKPHPPQWWVIIAFSLAIIAVLTSLFSPWIPFTFPLSSGLGILWFIIWLGKRPPVAAVRIQLKQSLYFGVTAGMTLVYSIFFIQIPDYFFDSLAYHRPFMDEFAATGSIAYVPNPTNWVEGVRAVFPHGVETTFGLAEQLIPHSSVYLHFFLLLTVLGGLFYVARQWEVRDPWAVTSFFLLSFWTIVLLKMFSVELMIFVWVLALVFLLWNAQKITRQIIIGCCLLAAAASFSKINAVVYITAFVGVAYLLRDRPMRLVWIPLTGALATGLFVTFAYLHNVDFFHVFQVVQATAGTPPVAWDVRFDAIIDSLIRVSGQFVRLGLMAAVILAVIHPPSRRMSLTIIAGVTAFGLAFLASNLYHYTYVSFGIYAVAFIGISVIAFAYAMEKMFDWLSKKGRYLLFWILIALIAATAVLAMINVRMGIEGNHFDTSKYYENMVEHIPNQHGTNIFFMNNINPITYGFEKSKVVDFTSFSRLAGDPCDFFHTNGITHIVYWAQGFSPKQIHLGDDTFYRATLHELKEENACTQVTYDAMVQTGPIIANVIQ